MAENPVVDIPAVATAVMETAEKETAVVDTPVVVKVKVRNLVLERRFERERRSRLWFVDSGKNAHKTKFNNRKCDEDDTPDHNPNNRSTASATR
jgi:hypothetical protein